MGVQGQIGDSAVIVDYECCILKEHERVNHETSMLCHTCS